MKLYSMLNIKKAMNEIKHGNFDNLEKYWITLEATLEPTLIEDRALQDTIDEKNERIINLNTKISKIRTIVEPPTDNLPPS